jgi:hypothetical protein
VGVALFLERIPLGLCRIGKDIHAMLGVDLLHARLDLAHASDALLDGIHGRVLPLYGGWSRLGRRVNGWSLGLRFAAPPSGVIIVGSVVRECGIDGSVRLLVG